MTYKTKVGLPDAVISSVKGHWHDNNKLDLESYQIVTHR